MKQNIPFFSVIIPVYNSSKYLQKCINSIICQKFQNYEVVFVDDGSTDSSVNIISKEIKGYANFKLIKQENQGVSAARNKGLKNASGKYVMFMDSDDYWENGILSRLSKILLAHKSVDILFFNIFEEIVNVRKNHDVAEKYLGNKLSKSDAIESVLSNRGYRGYSVNKVFKRSCIGNIRFDEDITYLEDMLFNISCIMNANEYMGIDDCLYVYRWRPSSVVNTFEPSHMTLFDALNKISNLIPHEFDDAITVKKKFTYIDFASRFIFKNKKEYNYFQSKFAAEKNIFRLNEFGLGKTELIPLSLGNFNFTVAVLSLKLIKKLKNRLNKTAVSS